MPQTLQAKNITLADLAVDFGLVKGSTEPLFAEGSVSLPNLSVTDLELLNKVKAEYQNLSVHNVLEPIVKMVVLSPLLSVAGFFLPPFRITAEKKVELVTEDDGLMIRGLIDLLVFYNQIWVVTIEAKRADYSLKVAFPQLLTYMLTSPTPQPIVSGLVTNGSEFRFIQLNKGEKPGEKPTYVMSDLLAIDRGDDLVRVAQILKYLGQQVL
jgi:Type I restriction enzyme R protein N terminus (HSDR_N)